MCRRSTLALPGQGWKLHVSASAADAIHLLERVLPALLEFDVAFKLPDSADDLIRINSGQVGATQVGKVITVYPGSDDTLRRLVGRLELTWRPSRPPTVPSDIGVSAHGGLWLRYGAFDGRAVVTNSLGFHRLAMVAPDGTVVADTRTASGSQVAWAPEPPVPPAPTPPVLDPSAPIRVDGATYLRLKALASNVGSRVDLAMRLPDCELAVVKTAEPGACCDHYGADAVTRLENEHAVLRAQQHWDGSPKVLGFDGAAHVLAMEDLGGVALSTRPADERLASLPALAWLVADLHALGFVHRDLKLANVVSTDGGLRLVDFETAAAIGTPAPIHAGTDGYVPPEGRHAPAQEAYDVHGLGGCVTHACLAYCPSGLPRVHNAGRQLALLALTGQHAAARVVRAAQRAEARDRPTARALAVALSESEPALRSERRPAWQACRPREDARWARRAAVEAGIATRGFRVATSQGHCWRNAHLLADFDCEALNVGAAGIVLGLASIDTALGTRQFDGDVIGGAEWLAARPSSAAAHGLFTGNAGVAVALGLAGRRYARPDLLGAARERFEAAASSAAPDFDLFSGAAGTVWAGCLLSDILQERWPLEIVAPQAERILDAAIAGDGVMGWPAHPDLDDDRTVHFGAAHGTAGIAMALSAWGRATASDRVITVGDAALASIHAHGLDGAQENIFATATGTSQPAQHWCHGAAGYLWCLLQAHGDADVLPRARAWAIEALDRSAALLDNPTLCHGLAGVLETWRMLTAVDEARDLARRRATEVVAVLRILHRARDGVTVWSSEHGGAVSPDLWVGFLGPAVSLAMSARGVTDAVISATWLARCADQRTLRAGTRFQPGSPSRRTRHGSAGAAASARQSNARGASCDV